MRSINGYCLCGMYEYSVIHSTDIRLQTNRHSAAAWRSRRMSRSNSCTAASRVSRSQRVTVNGQGQSECQGQTTARVEPGTDGRRPSANRRRRQPRHVKTNVSGKRDWRQFRVTWPPSPKCSRHAHQLPWKDNWRQLLHQQTTKFAGASSGFVFPYHVSK